LEATLSRSAALSEGGRWGGSSPNFNEAVAAPLHHDLDVPDAVRTEQDEQRDGVVGFVHDRVVKAHALPAGSTRTPGERTG
jgi:hypothetical protein